MLSLSKNVLCGGCVYTAKMHSETTGAAGLDSSARHERGRPKSCLQVSRDGVPLVGANPLCRLPNAVGCCEEYASHEHREQHVHEHLSTFDDVGRLQDGD